MWKKIVYVEAFSDGCQISKMEMFKKKLILDVGQNSEYVSDMLKKWEQSVETKLVPFNRVKNLNIGKVLTQPKIVTSISYMSEKLNWLI